MASKNPCGKTRTKDKPYEIWKSADDWTWYVLKKNQSPEKEKTNPYASWFCLVVTPFTGSHGDMGDTYVRDIKAHGAVLTYRDPSITEF